LSDPKPPPDPNAPPKRKGRTQTKRGNRDVDQFLPGAGQPRPPQLLAGRKPGSRVAPFSETLHREMPRIPEVLPDGTEVSLSEPHRKILAGVLAGCTTTEIAKSVGMTVPAVRSLLAGRTSAHVREAFRLLLEGSGIDAVRIVSKTLELLEATRAQWNPAKQDWDHFPDYATQLGTWRPLVQLLGFMPARLQAAQGGGPAVAIFTNLEADTPAPDAAGGFTIVVGKKAAARTSDLHPIEEALLVEPVERADGE
jgi:hypothetical protein